MLLSYVHKSRSRPCSTEVQQSRRRYSTKAQSHWTRVEQSRRPYSTKSNNPGQDDRCPHQQYIESTFHRNTNSTWHEVLSTGHCSAAWHQQMLSDQIPQNPYWPCTYTGEQILLSLTFHHDILKLSNNSSLLTDHSCRCQCASERVSMQYRQ
ncbi:unnamed protein product [Ixodes pacificus]